MWTRGWLLLLTLGACRFNPTIEDISLVGCIEDSDCPREASCQGGVCVSSPLTIESVTAEPASVEAGESCTFVVHAVHSLGPSRFEYRWAQVLGPRVELATDGNSAQITTQPDFIGSYELEVTVANGLDPPQRGRASCVALRTDDAAFAVYGHNGDCSRDNPCGTLTEAEATGARAIYLGVDEGTDRVTIFDDALDSQYDDREIHGGFLFPGWRRDVTLARTTNRAASVEIAAGCTRCVISGLYHYRLVTETWSDEYGVYVSGNELTLRELHIEVAGGGGTVRSRGIYVPRDRTGVNIEGVRIVMATAGDMVFGIDAPGIGATIRDTTVDLAGARGDDHIGVEIETEDWLDSRPTIDRLMVHAGDAIDSTIGLNLDCTAPRVRNTIVIADSFSNSQALRLDGHAACPSGTVIHSSLFAAGHGQTARAVGFYDTLRDTTIRNSILDAGDGFARTALDIDAILDSSTYTYDLRGSVLVLEGGAGPVDTWGSFDDSTETVDGLESLLGCTGCLSTADTAAYANREAGDFHLTADSSCCIGAGEPLVEGDPMRDYDGVPRPPDRPAVGPYEP